MKNLPFVLGFIPLLLLAGLIILGILTGRIPASGLWRDCFQPTLLSPVRVYQSVAMLAAASAVFIGLAQTGGTAFAPFPKWLFSAAGGGNIIYLGAKLVSLKQQQKRRQ